MLMLLRSVQLILSHQMSLIFNVRLLLVWILRCTSHFLVVTSRLHGMPFRVCCYGNAVNVVTCDLFQRNLHSDQN